MSDYSLFMTEKKENILLTAQQLFAEHGYASTSTKSIAQNAGVSEGLIFKHFGNKEGLLDAIVEAGLRQVSNFFSPLLKEEDPKKVIQLALEIPVEILREHKDYWKLQLSLKYQSPGVADKYHNSEVLASITTHVEQAFKKLGYANPAQEAMLLQTITTSLFTQLIDEAEEERMAFMKFVQSKYA